MFGGSLSPTQTSPFSGSLLTLDSGTTPPTWANLTASASPSSPHPPPRHQCALAVLTIGSDVVVYLLGGSDDSPVPYNDFWAFSTTAMAWHQFSSTHAYASIVSRGDPIFAHSMLPISSPSPSPVSVSGNKVLVVVSSVATLDTLEMFTPGSGGYADQSSGGWSTMSASGAVADRPDLRRHSAVVSLDTRVVVFGGRYRVSPGVDADTNDAFVLNVTSSPWAWSRLAPSGTPPSIKQGMASAVLGGDSALGKALILILGGRSGNDLVDERHVLALDDPSGTPAWYSITPATVPNPAASFLRTLALSADGTTARLVGGIPVVATVGEYALGPRVETVSPSASVTTGGRTLTITGSLASASGDLGQVVLVHSGTKAQYPCPIVSGSVVGTPVTQLACTVTGPIPVTYFSTSEFYTVALSVSSGLPPISPLTSFDIVPIPSIGSIGVGTAGDTATPETVSASLTLRGVAGTNFMALDAGDIESITVGGTPCASPNFVSPTEITCTAPSLSASKAAVRLSSHVGGAAPVVHYVTYVPKPTISALSRLTGGMSGGDEIVISGTWLGGTGVDISSLPGASPGDVVDNPAVSVTIASTPCTITAQSNTEVRCTTTAFSSTGSFTLVLTTQNGGMATSSLSFTVNSSPVVTTVDPSSGVEGTLVRVTGTSLGLSPLDILSVMIGNASCTVQSTENTPVTALTCALGNSAVGTYPVVVTTSSGGEGSSTVEFTVEAGVAELQRSTSPPPSDDEWPMWLIAAIAGGSVLLCCLLLLLLCCCCRSKDEDEYSSYYEYSIEEVIRKAPLHATKTEDVKIVIPSDMGLTRPNKILLKKRVRRRKAELDVDVEYEEDLNTSSFFSDDYYDDDYIYES